MTYIGVSPLTGNVFQGKVNKEGTSFVGEKKDITSQFLRCVIEKAEFHDGEFEIRGGNKHWIVAVREITEEKS